MKTYRWISLIVGVLLLIFSFTLLSNPVSGLVAAAVFLGIIFLMHGIGEISMYFSLPHDDRSAWLLISGLVSFIFGVWTLTAQGTASLVVTLPFILATWVLFFGVLRIVASISLRAFSPQLSTVSLVLGIIGVVLGFILLHHPTIGDFIISSVVFAIFICQGIGSITNFFLFKK